MFNFFDEIKTKMKVKEDALYDYNIVNISGRLLYAEGHKGILLLSDKKVAFKIKKGQVEVCGSGLILAELNENVLFIQGKIERVETIS
ncbi:MAG: YabP/YqfC family sporulation protein [Clostridia bacterium]|nr:YabP/YqfC family sporulation protein [Clostridia bacterium]